MPTTILATKLNTPPLRSDIVPRSRLIQRLNQGLHRPLSIISAPAGFGKTTLVSAWLATCDLPAAWLSLDEYDCEPIRFLTYLVAALATVVPRIGTELLPLLQSPQPPPIESVVTVLVNEITAFREPIILVLDDYHVVDATAVDDILLFLVEHLPPQMHLVITTRADPNLPLARIRARGQLIELRAKDLRFSPSEASEFLNQGMGLDLSSSDVAALEERTEGWIAGLQLAGLSLQGQEDVSRIIKAFSGDHRYIVDYLIEEVLERQLESVRQFLLQTSILDRLNGALCEAVCGQPDSKQRLDALERSNYFITPLDDNRYWYRYHSLFAQVLQARLIAEQPDHVATLHQRASLWYEQNNSVEDAIRHALAAKDFERAANLIERAAPAMLRYRKEAALLGWLRLLPIELFRFRPVLSVQYVGVLLSNGKLEGVEDLLRDVERWIDMRQESKSDATEMIVMDEAEFRALPSTIAMYRAGQALAVGNVGETMKYAGHLLNLVSVNDYLRRGAAMAMLGLASWTVGDLDAAYQTYAEGMANLQWAGNISDVVGGTLALADIQIAQGHLRLAMRTYERGLQIAMEGGMPILRGTADMHVGISELYREFNDLEAAMQRLLRSKEQGEHTGFPQNPYRWHVALARIREAQGDLDTARNLLEEAEHLYVSDMYPNVRPIAAMKTRIWIAQGQLGKAMDWVREQNLSPKDDLSYLHEFDHITLARVLLARHKLNPTSYSIIDAMSLLNRLLHAAETGGRMGRVVEILIIQALVHQTQNDVRAAQVLLNHALTLAEPEGYVRIFADEGPPMASLLQREVKRGNNSAYLRQLLSAFSEVEHKSPSQQNLTEPLSERELNVLRLLSTDLTGPEIARELIISLSTLRTHTQNIYTKLGVNYRRAAVNRAEELGLL